MTNHPNPNSAAQAATNNTAQHVLTDDEINTACDWPAANTTMRAENDRAMAREVEAAVLRKLRAPVADERAAFEAKFPLPSHCQWIGNGYAATDYNAWSAHTHKDRWEGWQARAALASAPVAGEAVTYLGDTVAERLESMADDQPPGSQAQSDLYAAATIWRKHIGHHAAPQASAEAFKDLVTHGMSIQRVAPADFLADRQQRAGDAERWRWATATDENAQGLYTIVQCYGGDQQKINERADFYRAALSATQPEQGERDA